MEGTRAVAQYSGQAMGLTTGVRVTAGARIMQSD
jgi:hypothetical protein